MAGEGSGQGKGGGSTDQRLLAEWWAAQQIAADAGALASIPQSGVVGLPAALAALAPSASPTFTGTVTVPDAANPTDAAQLSDATDAAAAAQAAAIAASDTSGAAAAAQAYAIQRANHTGTQTLSTISDAGTAASHPSTDFAPSTDPLTVGPRTYIGQAASAAINVGSSLNARYTRVYGGGTITKLRIYVAVQSGNIDVGVYSNSGVGANAIPGARKNAAGSTACPAVGYADIAIASTAVVEGDWIGVAADNVTVTFAQLQFGYTASGGAGVAAVGTSQFPLPATAGNLSASQYGFQAIGIP